MTLRNYKLGTAQLANPQTSSLYIIFCTSPRRAILAPAEPLLIRRQLETGISAVCMIAPGGRKATSLPTKTEDTRRSGVSQVRGVGAAL